MTTQTIMILMLMNVPPTVSTTTRIIVLVLSNIVVMVLVVQVPRVKFVTGMVVCTAEVDDVVSKSVLSVRASVTV